MKENQETEKKSLSFLRGKKTDWDELAKDCVGFANSKGGTIYIGIEDDSDIPPLNQKITDSELPQEIQKAIGERTINTNVIVSIIIASNKGEYIEIQIFRNDQSIASTTKGQYYVRIGDECKPVPPDELARLATEKNTFIWEEQVNRRIPVSNADSQKISDLLNDIRKSNRVSRFIKEKSDNEILQYYFLKKGKLLTNLGVLWVGRREDRAGLLYAPQIQVIRYNEQDEKVWKESLDDFSLNPKELLQKIENGIPDWKEGIEISDGLFRKVIPLFPIEVIRELIVNALAHRTYTTRGDIFINLFPDRLEIHSPGLLPWGVTPKNILTESRRRNEHLSKLFYDLSLMEREGSGYDLIYERLLGTGKPIPTVIEGEDRVTVIVYKQIIRKEIVRLMEKANFEYQLRQKEIITLGLIAQNHTLSAIDLAKTLNQTDSFSLRYWMGRLIDLGLILKRGKTKGVEYFVNPDYLRKLDFRGKTDLKTIESHRLKELLLKDIETYPSSAISTIHERIGFEINIHKIRRMLNRLVSDGYLIGTSSRRWKRYSIAQKEPNNQ